MGREGKDRERYGGGRRWGEITRIVTNNPDLKKKMLHPC